VRAAAPWKVYIKKKKKKKWKKKESKALSVFFASLEISTNRKMKAVFFLSLPPLYFGNRERGFSLLHFQKIMNWFRALVSFFVLFFFPFFFFLFLSLFPFPSFEEVRENRRETPSLQGRKKRKKERKKKKRELLTKNNKNLVLLFFHSKTKKKKCLFTTFFWYEDHG
jgi:hypothetical protein